MNWLCKSKNALRLLRVVGEYFNRRFPHNVTRLFESRHTETHRDTVPPRGTHPHTHTHVSLICNHCSVWKHVLLVLFTVITISNGKVWNIVSFFGTKQFQRSSSSAVQNPLKFLMDLLIHWWCRIHHDLHIQIRRLAILFIVCCFLKFVWSWVWIWSFSFCKRNQWK